MACGYPIPASQTRVATSVSNSRFICTVGEARSVEAAQSFIQHVKAELFDASSHAYAYRIGFGASVIDGCSDGGEPSGTAGRPMLAVLQGSGLGDVVAVVSRYFGGAKLGTGGLVRAFSGALKAALDALPRTERIARRRFLIAIPYPLYERTRRLLGAATIEAEQFGLQVQLQLAVAEHEVAALQRALCELSAGQIVMTPMD
jgi:uncharacterized YigZ family protein